jgi:outer membrane protein OmpA-like peptidoglycan-associated protein
MLFLSIFVALWGFALDKNDFEEVNFAFDSDVLVDGFPSMLRLADMLANAPEYIVAIEGHCDGVGGDTYNDKLAMKRVEAVKNFLIKYGAKPEQIEVAAQGKRNPKADNSTKEGRFINRRVIFTLYKMVDGRKVEVKADAPIS